MAYDDFWNANTQSGTQWDGFRHFAHIPTQTFYNGTKPTDIVGPTANLKCSQHYWADHGIAGRGILLDWKSYAERKGIPFNPYESDSISLAELQACGKDQGIDIRPASQGGDVQVGDMLFVRSGFISSYFSKTPEEREKLALRPHALGPDDGQRWAGLKQEEPMLDWLHDCWFATVAGDSPTFERWPTPLEYYLHEYVLALWGCPIGEMVDLEQLSRTCREKGRWSFFVTSSPANVHGEFSHRSASFAIALVVMRMSVLMMTVGGVASHVNGLAIF